MSRILLTALAAATCVSGVLANPAAAHERRHHRHDVYDSRGRYYEPQPIRSGDRIWRGSDGRYYCKRDNGTTGLIIGGAVGALLGR